MTGTYGYQLYFTDHSARLVGHQRFKAESDLQALRLAGAVFHLCHDECEAAELWRNGERVYRLHGDDGDRPSWVTGSAADLAVELEERLANSRWSIARSRRLLDALTKRSS